MSPGASSGKGTVQGAACKKTTVSTSSSSGLASGAVQKELGRRASSGDLNLPNQPVPPSQGRRENAMGNGVDGTCSMDAPHPRVLLCALEHPIPLRSPSPAKSVSEEALRPCQSFWPDVLSGLPVLSLL